LKPGKTCAPIAQKVYQAIQRSEKSGAKTNQLTKL